MVQIKKTGEKERPGITAKPEIERFSTLDDLRVLIKIASERTVATVIVPESGWAIDETSIEKKHPTEKAQVAYEDAKKLAETLVSSTIEPKRLFEILRVIENDPMKDNCISNMDGLRGKIASILLSQYEASLNRRPFGFGV